MKSCSAREGKGCENFRIFIGRNYIDGAQYWNFCVFCGSKMEESDKYWGDENTIKPEAKND